MLKIVHFISSYCLLLAGNDCCSKTSSGSSGQCLLVPPARCKQPVSRGGVCPPRAQRTEPGRAAHAPAAPRAALPGRRRLLWRRQMSHGGAKARGDARPARGGRRQQAVPGSRCPHGELAPARVPPSRSAGRCFWRFLTCGFSDPNSATAT